MQNKLFFFKSMENELYPFITEAAAKNIESNK